MIDLEIGVRELFEEARYSGHKRWIADEEGSSIRGLRLDNNLARNLRTHDVRLAYHYAQRERDKKLARATRFAYAIIPATVTKVTCHVCGHPGELREGVPNRIFHSPVTGYRSNCKIQPGEGHASVSIEDGAAPQLPIPVR